ncbi:hypothetical protein AVEN_117531-1 [Araneus ventricosus]|uniref:Uncharacterized protein n=1 Tax=Araneus ventricosus TaxID=182803 RepID=A0A4Y2WPG0_ARAVE|nr:hypothetical protein AVEN_117531-1 [Araneus ventricosus]
MKSPAHSFAQQDLARLPECLLPYKISQELVFGKLPKFSECPFFSYKFFGQGQASQAVYWGMVCGGEFQTERTIGFLQSPLSLPSFPFPRKA